MVLLKDSERAFQSSIDWKGTSFFFGAIFFLMFGLNLLVEEFSISRLIPSSFFLAISFLFLLSFFRHERGQSNPILDVALLRSRPFLAANFYNMIIGAGVFGVFSFIPLYATSVHKLSTLASGMILAPRSIGTIPASAVTSFLLRRWGYRRPMVVGLILISVSTLLLADQGFRLLRGLGICLGIPEMLALLIMGTGIGMGIALPASNNACIELMPERVATITGLRGMFRAVGGAFGISLITMILHLSSTPQRGFSLTFTSFGLGLLLAIPLVFLMPSGRARN